MARKKASADVRKQQIINAAMKCFRQKGYEKTTVDDIAAEFGLSKGSIYCYYPSKKDILIGVYSYVMTKMVSAHVPVVQSDISAKQKLIRMGQATIEMLQDDYDLFRTIVVLWSVAFEDEELRAMTAELYKRSDQLIKEILVKGEEDGEFIVPNKDATSALLIAVGEGIFTRQIIVGDLDLDGVKEELSIVVDRFFPAPKKETPLALKIKKDVLVNALSRSEDGRWEDANVGGSKLRDADVVLMVGLTMDDNDN